MMMRAPLTPEFVEQRLSELQQFARLGASLAEAELPPIDRRLLERRSVRVVGVSRATGSMRAIYVCTSCRSRSIVSWGGCPARGSIPKPGWLSARG